MDDTPAAITPDRFAVPHPRAPMDASGPATTWPVDAPAPVGAPAPAVTRSPEVQRLSQPLTFRPRRRWPRVAVFSAVALALVAAVALNIPTSNDPVTVGQVDPGTPAASVAATTAPAASAPPTVDGVLAVQGGALVTGDRAGFLRPVAHADAKTRALYAMLYANLRALHVARWDQIAVEDGANPAGALLGVRTEHLTVVYCFGDPQCTPTGVAMTVKIRTAGGTAEIVGATAPAVASTPFSRYKRVPPWALAPLRFAARGRVIVAASSAESSALAATLTVATRAAAVADRYAHWGRPRYYVVYLASATEFTKWFSPEDPGRNILGYTYNLSSDDAEVTVAVSRAAAYPEMGGVAGVVQHEFGHVATMAGLDPYGSSRAMAGEDSFLEGIAELCADDGHASWGHARDADVRAYLRGGKWSGHAFLTKEFHSSDNGVVSAAYGIGYLAMLRLVGRFGLARTLAFWGAVERDGADFDGAARANFGIAWKTLETDIKAYVNRTVHA